MKLIPYESVDHYRFGSKQAEIKQAVGKPASIDNDKIMQEIREIRAGITCTYIDKKLADVIIVKGEQLQIDHIDIFADPNPVQQLEQTYQANYSNDRTYVLFAELGVCLGGCTGTKVPEGRIAICFAQERLEFYKIYLEM